MPTIMQVLGTPDAIWSRPYYLVRWDLDARDGAGSVTLSPDPTRAHLFPTVAVAMAAYTAMSPAHPVRPDGAPNRPLTAYSVAFVPFLPHEITDAQTGPAQEVL